MKRLCALLLLCLASPVFAQFRVTPTTIDMVEGGKVHILVIVSGEQRFTLRQPAGFGFRVDPVNKSILFKSADEKTAISFQLTTNAPGQLPDQEVLRAKVTVQTPGAGIIQASTCSSGYKPGCFFDLVRILREGMSVRFRHVYVPGAEGMTEFVFATDNKDFESQRFIFSNFVNSFRLESAGPRSLAQE